MGTSTTLELVHRNPIKMHNQINTVVAQTLNRGRTVAEHLHSEVSLNLLYFIIDTVRGKAEGPLGAIFNPNRETAPSVAAGGNFRDGRFWINILCWSLGYGRS
jgi:hypothetical protein